MWDAASFSLLMKTVLTVFAAWVVAGCLVVAMDRSFWGNDPGVAAAAPAGALTAGGSANLDVRVESPRPGGIAVVPVSGISARELRDSFNEQRSGGRRHDAIDILAPRGTPVVAAVDGTIRKLFTSRAGGLTIYQYDAAEKVIYYYAHLDGYRDGIVEGMQVARGELIGYVGVTGNAGNTPHLHFSIGRLPPTKEWWKGQAVNPYPVLMGLAVP